MVLIQLFVKVLVRSYLSTDQYSIMRDRSQNVSFYIYNNFDEQNSMAKRLSAASTT
jgi:hypothetical protein